nr:FYVE zinc finger domain-containing protein [Deltaproteobacteria bacterium]
MSKRCKSCRTEFTVYWTWRHRCAYCHHDYCDKCSERYVHPRPNKAKREEICKDCYGELRTAVDDVTVVKGQHVGGHRITEEVCEVETSLWRRDPDAAVWDAQFLAHHHKANALLRMRLVKGTDSEPTGRRLRGEHYYSVFRVRGLAAVVKPTRRTGRG